MANNKFIERLRGELNSTSRIEINDKSNYAPLNNLPDSTDSIYGTSADKNTASVFATGSAVWAIDLENLIAKDNSYLADGSEYTGAIDCEDAGVWIDRSYTFSEDGDAQVGSAISADSNFVMNLFGVDFIAKDLKPVNFTLVVKFGTQHIFSKQFSVTTTAGRFHKRFEMQLSNVATNMAIAGKTMQVQLICEENDISAKIFAGVSHIVLQDCRIEHNELFGRDAKDAHPISAITGLRDELDDHNDRITDNRDDIDAHEIRITANEEEIAEKQDIITDLDTIRSGASAGATALQPSALTAHNTSSTAHEDIREELDALIRAKLPNVVIVGDVSITNGVMSGFSADSYAKFPFIVDLGDNEFDLYFKFTTSDNVIDSQAIIDSKFGMYVGISTGNVHLGLSTTGEEWDIGMYTGSYDIQENTTYYCKLTFHGNRYIFLISEDDITYTEDLSFAGASGLYPRTIYIGGGNAEELGASFPFDGSIDLNFAKLVINNEVVWNGMDVTGLATKANVSLSNLDSEGQSKFDAKQDVLTAGDNINIVNNVVSANVPKWEVVDELPAEPEEDKFYFVKE